MSDWVNDFPFAWLLIAVLALSYVAATAIYTRVMMLIIDRRARVPAEQASGENRNVEWASEIVVADRSSGMRASADKVHGTEAGWDRLTSGDIERVKRALAARRAKALAQHSAELKILDAEQAEID